MAERARSFGSVAVAYHRYRPDYPAEVADAVLQYADRPVRTALEIGAGTGKATRLFADRGIRVRATDPDAGMLAELRRHVPAAEPVQASFEDLPPSGAHDLVFAAAAMHWTAPQGRWPRVAAHLVPEGVFAAFGNPVQPADPAVEEALEAAQAPYLRRDDVVAPGLPAAGGHLDWPRAELVASPWFTDVQEVVVGRRLTVPVEEFLGQLATVSAYVVLPAGAREELWARLRQVLPERVELLGDITVHLARRAQPPAVSDR